MRPAGATGFGSATERRIEASSQQPLSGRDGDRAASLLARAQDEGAAVLGDVAYSAVRRLVRLGEGRSVWRVPLSRRALFAAAERQDLINALAATVGTAELLGRTRILRRLALHRDHGEAHHGQDCFSAFADGDTIRPLVPEEALAWFRALVPSLDLEPDSWITGLRRRCFTLAVATETTLLERVQSLIARALETGRGISSAPRRIASLLDDAGVSPRNSQYTDMVFRTNLRDAYMQGAQEQLDEVKDYFPVWRYAGIDDGRQGDDHAPHFDKYYPSSVPFTKVRDSLIVRKGRVVFSGGKGRPFNCRCDMIPISHPEWTELQKAGARLERLP